MQFWIIGYHHRHGTDMWPMFSEERPDLETIADGLDDWEPDRDEWLECEGPFQTP